MTIQNIRLVGQVDITIPVVGAVSSDPYILKSADGLGPPEVDVSVANTLYQGSVYQGRRPQNREIVLRVGLNPNYRIVLTASELRDSLYTLMSTIDPISVRIEYKWPMDIVIDPDLYVKSALGYIKRIEIVPFTKEPEVQIVVTCLSPYLVRPSQITVVNQGSPPTIDYVGTAPGGFMASITIEENLNTLAIYTAPYNSQKVLKLNYAFLAGDVLNINTIRGQRSISRVRSSVSFDLSGSLTTDSTWFDLYNGSNVFAVGYSVGSAVPTHTWESVRFTPNYWGI